MRRCSLWLVLLSVRGEAQETRFEVSFPATAHAEPITGGSTGGWEALALQLFHPDFFGGTWAYCPDPVTFSAYEGIDI